MLLSKDREPTLFERLVDRFRLWSSGGIEERLEHGESICALFRDNYVYFQNVSREEYETSRDIVKQVTKFARMNGE